MITEVVEMQGHLLDSLLYPKVCDIILSRGGDYRTVQFDIGRTNADTSIARLELVTEDADQMESLLAELQIHGVNPVELGTAELAACTMDGVLPAGFFSTSNLPTSVRISDRWIAVENPEMDCAIVVSPTGSVRTVPMHRVRMGDQVVVGRQGVRVELPAKAEGSTGFEFMNSDLSPEKPKGVIVTEVANRIRGIKEPTHPSPNQVLAVCGPAVVHTGAAPSIASLVRNGWIDVLFAGNGFATHDIESNVMGTSLGVSVASGAVTEGGHSNHLRVINEVRRYGSIAAAVEAGYIEGGVMFECVRRNVPFVLAGSVRDDGPLPDVMTDVVQAADAMRYLIGDVGLALMLSSTLHGVATGNVLPAIVETYCVDINQSVVTKLSDRGSHQAKGIVTDVGLFATALERELVGDRG